MLKKNDTVISIVTVLTDLLLPWVGCLACMPVPVKVSRTFLFSLLLVLLPFTHSFLPCPTLSSGSHIPRYGAGVPLGSRRLAPRLEYSRVPSKLITVAVVCEPAQGGTLWSPRAGASQPLQRLSFSCRVVAWHCVWLSAQGLQRQQGILFIELLPSITL
jgi:hypothetical protein